MPSWRSLRRYLRPAGSRAPRRCCTSECPTARTVKLSYFNRRLEPLRGDKAYFLPGHGEIILSGPSNSAKALRIGPPLVEDEPLKDLGDLLFAETVLLQSVRYEIPGFRRFLREDGETQHRFEGELLPLFEVEAEVVVQVGPASLPGEGDTMVAAVDVGDLLSKNFMRLYGWVRQPGFPIPGASGGGREAACFVW